MVLLIPTVMLGGIAVSLQSYIEHLEKGAKTSVYEKETNRGIPEYRLPNQERISRYRPWRCAITAVQHFINPTKYRRKIRW